jgi:outer membrane protein OmpA-like peptidoglycan-associated protein
METDMPHPREDSTVWIGYADFLTTLTILFFILVVGLAARTPRGPAVVSGDIRNGKTGQPVVDCLTNMGPGRKQRTDSAGMFRFKISGISERIELDLRAECAGYEPYEQPVEIVPADTVRVPIVLNPDTSHVITGDSAIRMISLPGDELFERNDFRLRPEAIGNIRDLGLRYKQLLHSSEVIAVQGHTDDSPFPPGAGKDNWILSGERASAAAKVLTDPMYGVGIPECQVIIMGFGPSRPIEPVHSTDRPNERDRKRMANRRIEFRMLKGAAIAGGICG